MAGILNSKTRIFDTVLTTEGRRQLAAGTFNISFASFSDSNTFYERDLASGSADAGKRIFLEAATSLRDQITFETDDSGLLIPYESVKNNTSIAGDKILLNNTIVSNGTSFASLSGEVLSSSIENFKNLMLLGTEDIFKDTSDFKLNRNTATFTITDTVPFAVNNDITETSVDNVESLYQDKRLSHIPNFKYLPPVNKNSSVTIGNFSCLGEKEILTFEQLEKDLENKEKIEITFPSTSRENNLVSQLFELSEGKMKKLDIIDFGEFVTSDESKPDKQVFFAGKIFIDSKGMPTFVNQFVLVFD